MLLNAIFERRAAETQRSNNLGRPLSNFLKKNALRLLNYSTSVSQRLCVQKLRSRALKK